MQPGAQRRIAVLALFLGVTGIGFAPLLVRMSEVGPSATAFYRLLFALPFIWFWMHREQVRAPEKRSPATARDFLHLALAGLLFVADLSIWHWSLLYTSVANSTLLTNLAPVFVTVGGIFIFGEKPTRLFVAGMVIGLIGAVLLVSESLNLRREHLLGDVLALVAALFYSGYLLSVKNLRKSFSGPTLLAWSGLVSCPGFLLVAICSREKLVPVHTSGWMVVIALAMFSHVGGQTLIAYAFGHLPASLTSLGLLWQPVVAGVLAWIFLHEALSWIQIAGGLVVLVGLAIANRAETKTG
ncbi:MAG TPA: DMT family transporter [Candidatus Saccharimonadales bacterium]|nr:DMT family transporter [Candidatus Saccharimonadales bacterium]